MKRVINIFLIAVVALLFVGCGNKYENRAKEWLLSNVNYINITDDDNTIYYIENSPYYSYAQNTYFKDLFKVNLETGEKVAVEQLSCDGVTYRFDGSITGFVLPADRGLEQGTTFAIVTRLVDLNDKFTDDFYYAFAIDAATQTAKLVNKSYDTRVYGDMIVSELKDAKYSNQLKGIEVYHLNGEPAAQPRQFKGTIAKQAVTAEIWISKGEIFGSYYYDKYGPNNRIKLHGELTADNQFKITGTTSHYFINPMGGLRGGDNFEYWIGKLVEGRIEAGFHKYPNDPKLYDFTLTEVLPATEVVE